MTHPGLRVLLGLLILPCAAGPVRSQTIPLFDGSFHRAPLVATSATVAIDINADGRPDLVGRTSSTSKPLPPNDGVGVFLGNGNGTFRAPIEFDTGDAVNTLAVADMDTNGTIDLVSTGSPHGLTVRRGAGDGSFQSPVTLPVSDAGALTLGDVTGDGLPDAIVAGATTFLFRIYLNSGAGAFSGGLPTSVSGKILAIAAARLDPDSLADLVVAVDSSGTSRILTYLSLGVGSLLPVESRVVAGAGSGLVVADFNGDGIDDVGAAAKSLPKISVMVGLGGGVLGATVEYNSGGGTLAIAGCDQDGDGTEDLAVQNDNVSVSVLLGRGDGSFRASRESPGFVAPVEARGVSADWNGDGRGDVLFGQAIYLSRVPGEFGHEAQFAASQTRVESGDLTGDGIADLVAVDFQAGVLSFLAGAGDGTFATFRQCPAAMYPRRVGVGDVDGDGIDDAVVVTDAPGGGTYFATHFGGPSAVLCHVAHTPSPDEVRDLRLADLDGDGRQDLVCVHDVANQLTVWKGMEDGTFQLKATKNALGNPLEVRLCDLNHDGRRDVVVVNESGNGLAVYLDVGGLDFSSPQFVPVGTSPDHVALSDFDGDENPDAIVHLTGSGCWLLRGDGMGSFAAPEELSGIEQATSPMLGADLDGDGIADLATGNDPFVEIWRGGGHGTFKLLEAVGGGGDLVLSSFDMDRNGTPDLVTAYADFFTTIPNRSPALPVPPVEAHVVDASLSRVSIEWQGSLGPGVEGRVFRRTEGGEWQARASVTSDTNSIWRFEDRSVLPGRSYEYDLRLAGRVVSTLAVPTPEPRPLLALAAVAPNPVRGAVFMGVQLPTNERAWLEVFDVKGRAIWTREVGSLGPGEHTVEVGAGSAWRSGVYRARLTQGSQVITRSFVFFP